MFVLGLQLQGLEAWASALGALILPLFVAMPLFGRIYWRHYCHKRQHDDPPFQQRHSLRHLRRQALLVIHKKNDLTAFFSCSRQILNAVKNTCNSDEMGTSEADARFHRMWDQAVKEYQEISDQKLNKDDISPYNLTSAKSLCNTIKSQNENFVSYKEKGQMVFEVMEQALKPIEFLGNLKAFPPSSLLFGAVMHLFNVSSIFNRRVTGILSDTRQAAHGVSDNYDAIVQIFKKFGNFIKRLEILVDHEIPPQLGEILLEVLIIILGVTGHVHKLCREGNLSKWRLKSNIMELFSHMKQRHLPKGFSWARTARSMAMSRELTNSQIGREE